MAADQLRSSDKPRFHTKKRQTVFSVLDKDETSRNYRHATLKWLQKDRQKAAVFNTSITCSKSVYSLSFFDNTHAAKLVEKCVCFLFTLFVV